jgi:hypothetical protein
MMQARHTLAGLSLAVLGATTALEARADPVTAEALFRAGRAAMDAGDPKEACARFAESQRLEPAAGTLLNLGECHEALGELASAWQSYVEASELLKDDRRPYALKKRAELEPRLARVEVRVEGGTGCTVLRAGVALGPGALALPLRVDAGAHTFVLRCPDRADPEASVTIAHGASKVVKLVPGLPATRNGRKIEPSGAGDDRPLLVAGLTLGGLGLAAVGAGIGTGVLAIDRKDEVEATCTRGDDGRYKCPAPGVEAADEGATFATASTALFIAGGIAVAAGLTMVVVDVASPRAPAVELGLMVGPTGFGVRGRW